MRVFQAIYMSARRALTGRVVRQKDVRLQMMADFSVRLKTNGPEQYVVVAVLASGNYQYFPMDLAEFDAVTDAMNEIREIARKDFPDADWDRLRRSNSPLVDAGLSF